MSLPAASCGPSGRNDGKCDCCGRTLRVASTTSLDNTGLLAAILPAFENRTGIKVHVLAVGTGQALKLARNGDADALLVHDPVAEKKFVDDGFGIHRTTIMFNDFVIVGPPGDPAKIRGLNAVEAMKRIAASGATFVSRGDQSGTHRAELRLWKAAGIEPSGPWYLESGRGQRLNLNMAGEKSAYCLTDRATFVTADGLALEILVEGDPRLHNPYSFIAVNPSRHPEARLAEAMALLGWLQSAEGRRAISEYRKNGKELFHPLEPAASGEDKAAFAIPEEASKELPGKRKMVSKQ
ncbi:MAG: hypothetical protein D6806_05205 [Deltaproteobacteria bacterium]|nr:MAG: hypothetical protein D6806_05205 [Deltaproteobacteria bacterium]